MPDVLMTVVALSTIFSGLIGPQSPATLEKDASIIVVGTAGPCSDSRPDCFQIAVDRVLKGEPSLAGSSLAASWIGKNPDLPPAGHGIWFLAGDGALRLVSPIQNGIADMRSIPTPEGPIGAAWAYNPSAPVTDKLAAELCRAIANANEESVRRNLELRALKEGGIDDLKSPVTKALWTRMAQSSTGPERLLGLAGLIRGGDIDAVVTAAKVAESLAQNKNEYFVLLRSIVDHFHPADDAAVVTLGQIATDANEYMEIRQATGHALAASGSPAAVQFLKMMANESDKTLRLESAVGLNDGAAMRRALESH